MRLPEPIYELLPYLYLVVGGADMVYFYDKQALGTVSGVLLLLTSFLVFRLRYENRRYPSTRRMSKDDFYH